MKIEKKILKSIEASDIVNGTVVIPSGVKEIADEAFLNCEELKNIIIPDSVKVIGKGAFKDCHKLKSVKLPNSIKELKAETFKNCHYLTSIEIPDSVQSIGEEVFYDCPRLGKVKLSSNLEKIGSSAFFNCSILPKITLPDSLKELGTSVFKECKNLRSIVIPPKIKRIPKNTFYFCHYLTKVTLPEGLTEIGEDAFFLCTALKHITLPNSLKEIEKSGFMSCSKLREIVIPKNVTSIGANAFDHCEVLSSVTLPEGIKNIGSNCFTRCYFLRKINLPDSLENIEKGAFSFCYTLGNVSLPKNLTSISDEMFYCSGIRELQIPETVTEIGSDAFEGCSYLKKINIPEGIKEIKKDTFKDCKSLSEIKLPADLKGIYESAFEGCKRLKELKLPEGIENLGLNFIKDCKKITSLHIPSSIKNFKNPNESYFSFVEKSDDGFRVLNEPTDNAVSINDIKISIPIFFKCKDLNPNLIKEQKNAFIADLYDTLVPKLSDEQLEDFMKSHNFTFFKQIMKLKPENSYFDRFNKEGFYVGYYNLGGFKGVAKYNGRNIDYSQKVTGKLLDYIDREPFRPFEKLSKAFEDMEIQGFKREFTEFFISSMSEMMEETRYNNEEFIARAYNEFEEIQATNTNDHGSQRQLKPTMDKFKGYFRAISFRNVTPETKPIAMMISPYFDRQENFDNAVSIMNEFKENNVPVNILSEPLVQENPFEEIDNIAERVGELQASTAKNMTQVATNEFTYEWLEKNDPTNLILGKLCSCCAHLNGAGYGIMHASIVHPNVQNLVIRNEGGKIVAKSTLFVNPDEQFGVLNNFEVQQTTTLMKYGNIYERLMEGIAAFAEQYNKEHPDKPLKQINVGAGNNDLIVYLEQYSKKAKNLLPALDYSQYGFGTNRYSGDSYREQYVVWENDELINQQKAEVTEAPEKQN